MSIPRDPNTPISVVMPVHNGGAYLRSAVQSILAQQDVTLELLIVDDHSTDSAIAELPEHPLLQILDLAALGVGRGIVPALNAGIARAQYPLIARMDGDDLAAPNRLRSQLDYFCAHPQVEIVGAMVSIFTDDTELGGGFQHYEQWLNAQDTPEKIAAQMFVECCIAHPTFFMRKAFVQSLGGYHDSEWPEDYDLVLRAHAQGARMGKPKGEPLLYWRDHSQRLSRNDARYRRNAFIACKAFYLGAFLKRRGQTSVAIWGAGPTGLKLHDGLESCGLQVTHFYDINPKLATRTKRGKQVLVAELPIAPAFLESLQRPTLLAISRRGAAQEMADLCVLNGLMPLLDFMQVS